LRRYCDRADQPQQAGARIPKEFLFHRFDNRPGFFRPLISGVLEGDAIYLA
jgi:hypothetical protein